MYAAWRGAAEHPDAFAERLVASVGPSLVEAGALAVQVNVVDHHVAAGDGPPPRGHRRVTLDPAIDAVVSAWVRSAVTHLRTPLDRVLGDAGVGAVGYLVSESVPLAPETPPAAGERTAGYTQVALLRRPAAMDEASWRVRWQDHHTEVAIRTQSTTAYRQNLVVRPLHDAAPPLAAIVEETFPLAALTDPYAFFDAVGDDARFAAHIEAMVASTSTFLDADGGIDVLPTSEYVVRPLG